MEAKPQLAERAAALSRKISANEVGAISGGAAGAPPDPPIVLTPAIGTMDSQFAATVITAYENIVQSTSDFIERVLGPYDSEP